jgi:hypothetical protein
MLIVSIPPCLPYMPFVDYAHLSIDYVNSFANCGNTSMDYTKKYIECSNKSNVCANTLDDWANTFVDSTDTLDKSSLISTSQMPHFYNYCSQIC